MDDEKGPLWKGFFTDLEAAKSHAQKSTDEEACEFWVYNFKDFNEIARIIPTRTIPKS